MGASRVLQGWRINEADSSDEDDVIDGYWSVFS